MLFTRHSVGSDSDRRQTSDIGSPVEAVRGTLRHKESNRLPAIGRPEVTYEQLCPSSSEAAQGEQSNEAQQS